MKVLISAASLGSRDKVAVGLALMKRRWSY